MSTTKKFGLSKLALQSNNAQSALSSMRNFYQNNATASVSNLAIRQQQQLQHRHYRQQQQQLRQLRQERGSMRPRFNSWPEERSTPHRVANVGRLSKVIGVKKTLVNQMQGMVQTLRPKMKSHSMGLTHSGSKYKIYGQTKVFSSMSSLQARSSCNNSSSAIFPPVSQRRCLSTSAQPAVALNSPVQHRYNQFGDLHEKRNGELARDISRSIQSELMEVDLTTKRLISCARGKLESSNYNPTVEDQQQHQQLQMQPHHQPLRFDPLGGWHHPRPMKRTEATASKEDNVKKQKALRRKPANIRYKEDSNEAIQQQFAKPSLQSHNLHAQLGELYAKSTKVRTKKQRSDLREQQFPSTLVHSEPASLQNNQGLQSSMFDERYKQTMSERDYIERNILKTEREEVAAAPLDANGRMDDMHYQSKIASNLMSASQRVINKQFEGYRSYLLDARHKSKQAMLTNSNVQTVSPTPLVKISSKPPAPKTRLLSLGRASSVKPKMSTDGPQAMTGNFAVPQSKRFFPNAMPHNKLQLGNSTSSNSKIATCRKLEKTMRSKSTNPSWNKSTFQQAHLGEHQSALLGEQKLHQRQALQSPYACQMQIGEMRDYQKPQADQPRDSLKNDVLMPSEYTKESAVQRLGNLFDKRASHAYLR